MDKLWLKNYPPGVPEEVDCKQFETVSQLLENSMTKYAERDAFMCMGKSITYGEVDALSRSLFITACLTKALADSPDVMLGVGVFVGVSVGVLVGGLVTRS